MSGAAPTILIDATANVKNFRLRDMLQINQTEIPLNFFVNLGTVERLFLDGVIVQEPKGQKQTEAITGKGTVQETIGNAILE
jgi:hypothetical protein